MVWCCQFLVSLAIVLPIQRSSSISLCPADPIDFSNGQSLVLESTNVVEGTLVIQADILHGQLSDIVQAAEAALTHVYDTPTTHCAYAYEEVFGRGKLTMSFLLISMFLLSTFDTIDPSVQIEVQLKLEMATYPNLASVNTGALTAQVGYVQQAFHYVYRPLTSTSTVTETTHTASTFQPTVTSNTEATTSKNSSAKTASITSTVVPTTTTTANVTFATTTSTPSEDDFAHLLNFLGKSTLTTTTATRLEDPAIAAAPEDSRFHETSVLIAVCSVGALFAFGVLAWLFFTSDRFRRWQPEPKARAVIVKELARKVSDMSFGSVNSLNLGFRVRKKNTESNASRAARKTQHGPEGDVEEGVAVAAMASMTSLPPPAQPTMLPSSPVDLREAGRASGAPAAESLLPALLSGPSQALPPDHAKASAVGPSAPAAGEGRVGKRRSLGASVAEIHAHRPGAHPWTTHGALDPSLAPPRDPASAGHFCLPGALLPERLRLASPVSPDASRPGSAGRARSRAPGSALDHPPGKHGHSVSMGSHDQATQSQAEQAVARDDTRLV